MKKFLSIFLCVAMIAATCIAFCACGNRDNGKTAGENSENGENGRISGGWTRSDSVLITDEFKKTFEKAAEGVDGVELVPVAYLSSQVVAGTNHCVLCKATPVSSDVMTSYALVYIYEDLNGNAEITEIRGSGVPAEYEELDGGWGEYTDPALTDEAEQALKTACETLAGVEYTPVALLATQVVAGMNYRILCEAKATVPDAESEYVIVDVAEALDGSAGISLTYEFENEDDVGIENPLEEYGADADSLEAAEDAVGFSLTVPGDVVPENYIVINGDTLEVDFEEGYIRKAKGDGDISGDRGEYENVEVRVIDGMDVTVKGNGDKIMLAIWVDAGYTYCVGLPSGTDEAGMTAFITAIK